MPDVLVIGGGVFGLWCARACLAAGLSVALAERGRIGAGASGGPVGALAPHDPTDWGPLRALQLEGLLGLPAALAALEAETGRAVGYRRCGRLRPLGSAAARDRVALQAAAAAARWQGAGRIGYRETPPAALAGLLAPEAGRFGWVEDTLTARIDPPALLAALAAALAGRAPLREGWTCHALEPGAAVFDRGRIAAGHVVLAAGDATLALAGLDGPRGAKGQAAVLAATLPAAAPLFQAPGLYVVGHAPGRVAVGSTNEPDWTAPGPDHRLEAVIAKARALLPGIAAAPVLHRWAGVRPRGPGEGPLVGALPDRPGLLVATAGHRIGLALAHLAGRAIAAEIAGLADGRLPAPFRPDRGPSS